MSNRCSFSPARRLLTCRVGRDASSMCRRAGRTGLHRARFPGVAGGPGGRSRVGEDHRTRASSSRLVTPGLLKAFRRWLPTASSWLRLACEIRLIAPSWAYDGAASSSHRPGGSGRVLSRHHTQRSTYRVGDMCEFQLIYHRLFVTLGYRHLPPLNRKQSPARVTESASTPGGSAARQMDGWGQDLPHSGGSPSRRA